MFKKQKITHTTIMRSLKNKIIVITGASRGIGREMALRFAKETQNSDFRQNRNTAPQT